MRVLARYLPQYHAFKENDEWWGKGYTEWTAVKSGKPLFRGHIQPRIPLNNNYYDLDKDGAETLRWQADLARKYGIYGFSFYQYYFKGHKLMEKPMETLLNNPDIDINYCICWANETWTRTWYGLESEVLISQEYGDEKDFKEHFDYLLQFFKDKRYIKIDNKPVLEIYKSFDIECLDEMLRCFRKWAIEAGFDDLYIISGKTAAGEEKRDGLVDGYYYFEPGYTLKNDFSKRARTFYNAGILIKSFINRFREKKLLERSINARDIIEPIIRREYAENEFPGLIPDWDNTPRRSYRGLVYKGTSPEYFERALSILKKKKEGHKVDFVYINAWNEWGEGAFLEPDEHKKYSYLEAVKRVVK
ncbi:MAG: glycoside hydrolase family 99-like domain-containing protein [Lachnospiraceae bacterium]|nr:glycoside hydrolase family 99-like domain-containing protein [Lachnospiraceae bacterium]